MKIGVAGRNVGVTRAKQESLNVTVHYSYDTCRNELVTEEQKEEIHILSKSVYT